MPWVALALVAVATACSHVAGAQMWKEAPSLPLSRRFHVAASDRAGVVYAFGGVVQLYPESRRHGLGGEFGMVILDPSAGAWRVGPRHPWFRYISRVKRKRVVAGRFGEPPVEVGVSESESTRGPEHEAPPGTGGRDGRIYWFAPPGPIIFDPEQGTWTQPPPPIFDGDERRWLPPVPTWVRWGGVTASAPDGKIYLVGGNGYTLDPAGHDPKPGNLHSLLDSLEVYDPAANTWESRAPLRRARQDFAGTFGRDGRLYVFGGYGHKGVVRRMNYSSDAEYEAALVEAERLSRRALRSVEIYDPATDRWSEGAPMPEGRHAMGAALGADGRIYVVGGAVSYSSPKGEDDVFVYDPAVDSWSRGPSLRTGRYHHAVTVTPDGKIYAIGGIGPKQERLVSVEVLDTAAPPPPVVPPGSDRG
jgi:N-acetylneuraminic acid mutarotase